MALDSHELSRDEQGRSALRAALFVHRRAPLSRILARRGFGPYRGYAELLEALDRLADRGARLLLLGRSVQGEPLLAVQLGNVTTSGAGTRDEAGAPSSRHRNGAAAGNQLLATASAGQGAASAHLRTSVIVSGLHPLEWIGVEAHLALLERLATVDLGDRSIVAVPMANPDGMLRVETNLRAGRHRYLRGNARGVDLNRNFDSSWHERGIIQRLIGLVFSPGSRPASEPEVEAMAHAFSALRIDRAVSLHSFGGAVLYPPANSLFPVADVHEHRTWAVRIANLAGRKAYRALSCVRFAGGLRQSGLELDWFHDRHGAISLLVECARGRAGLAPWRLVEPFGWYNPPNIEGVAQPLADALIPFVKGERP